jgi:hypothetical protein
MEIRFPDKATLAELFTDDEKPPDGADFVEILVLSEQALKLNHRGISIAGIQIGSRNSWL